MNALTGGEPPMDYDRMQRQIVARDRELDHLFFKDAQITALRGARTDLGDRLVRTAKPHWILDPAHGPFIAVRVSMPSLLKMVRRCVPTFVGLIPQITAVSALRLPCASQVSISAISRPSSRFTARAPIQSCRWRD